jgi:hypothetical protein
LRYPEEKEEAIQTLLSDRGEELDEFEITGILSWTGAIVGGTDNQGG